MDLIALHYLTEDSYFREMARLYWQTNKKNKFVLPIADLAARYQLRPGKLLAYVSQSAQAYIKDSRCALCGTPTRYLQRRADFYDIIRSQRWKIWHQDIQHFCPDCQDIHDQHRAQRQQVSTASRQLIKPIFKSRQHLQHYHALRERYPYVYPSVALAIFVPIATARAHFTQDWHEDYFYQTVIELVATREETMPQHICLDRQNVFIEPLTQLLTTLKLTVEEIDC
ncbi:MAG: hypothetical protein ACFCUI_09005 [Bernardetiaceae bacterium]